MGRRERPLDPDAGPVQAFACALRELRRDAGSPTYETMARRAFRSRSALSAAAGGDQFPSLALTIAYVTACGGDTAAWETRWRDLHRQLSTEHYRDHGAPPSVPPPARPRRPDPPPQLHPLLEQLAAAMAAHWSREAEVRGLHHPAPLPVRWTATIAGSADHAPVEGRFDRVGELFDRLACPRLVIVGSPGSGKTSLAVELVGQLLESRAPGQPVPVLLPIGSWNPAATHLRTWITTRLEELYPALRAPAGFGAASLARLFTEGRLIVPVLDGLDEMPPAIRPHALPAINRALGRTAPLVLTCRADEYRAAAGGPPGVLSTATVIALRPLEPDDIQRYLTAAIPPAHRDRWGPVFEAIRGQPDGALARALSTPLMAGIAGVGCAATAPQAPAYTATDPDDLLALHAQGRAAVEDHLLDRFVAAVYPDRPDPAGRPCRWTAAQADRWLRFLAVPLHGAGTRDLAWWRLYRAVPARRYTAAFAAIAALVVAVPLALFGYLKGGAEQGLSGALKDGLFGVMLGLAAAFGLDRDPSTVDTPGRAGRQARQLGRATLGGVLGGLAYWVATIPADGVLRGLMFGLSDGAVVGMVVGLTAAVADPYRPVHTRLRPSALRRYATAPMALGLTFGAGMGVLAAAIVGVYLGVFSGLMIGVGSGLALLVRTALGAHTDVARATSPAAIRRADRTAALGYLAVSAVLGGATVGVIATLVTGASVGIEFAVIYATVYAVAAYSFTAGHTFLVARACLVAGRRLPWRLPAFLDDAHRRGVLRQVGAVYQFRHARLHDRLAAMTAPPGATVRTPAGRFPRARRTGWRRTCTSARPARP